MNRALRTLLRKREGALAKSIASCLLYVVAALLVSCATHHPARDFSKELENYPEQGYIIKGFSSFEYGRRLKPEVPINSILRFWQRPPLTSSESASLVSDGIILSDIEVLHQVIAHRNLWSFACYGSIDEMEKRIASGLPILIMVQDVRGKASTKRFMIVMGFNRKKEEFLVEEGRSDPEVYTYKQLKKIWRPQKNWMLIVCPPEQIRWDLSLIEYVSLARYDERKGRWSYALDAYNRAENLDPDNLNLMLAKAEVLYQMNDLQGSIEYYRRVLSRDELNARAANNLAYTLADLNADIQEAEKLVRRALTIEPSNPVFLDTLGYILLKSGRAKEAAETLSRARYRAISMSGDDQRKIIERLIWAYLDSNQSHLARQVWLDHLTQDTEFMLDERLRGRMPE